jgi:hypothetical protein
MSPRVAFQLLLACLLALASTTAIADIVTVPTSLAPGSQYRLAFVTSGARDATSSDIATYNSFVNAAANAVPQLAALGSTWTAIASTATVNAHDNTNTNPASFAGVPIFLLNDTKLADNNADLWSGGGDAIDVVFTFTEQGSTFVGNTWTGSFSSGQKHTVPLGVINAVQGFAGSTTASWVTHSSGTFTNQRPLYAISGSLLVAAVPEANSLLLLSAIAGSGGALAFVRAFRRRQAAP